MRQPMISLVSLAFLCSPVAVSADEPAKPAPELRVLEDMIGAWDEVMSNKPTEWLPKAERSEAVTKKNWSLGGKFIRMEGVWKPAKTEFLSLVSYDPATKEYRTWYFDSAGGQPRGSVRGTWDDKTRTMTWTGTDEAGNKTVGKSRIVDRDTHEWTFVTTDPQGKVVLDISAKNTRRKE
jgi:hypothetical protein